jgi:molybdopterin synthase catalytic subunit
MKSRSCLRSPVANSVSTTTRFLTHAPIGLDDLLAQVRRPEVGGIATFLGSVRNHQDGRTVVRLEYSAYEPMAEAESARIVAEAESRWPATVALRHRLGTLAIGDAAVAVVAGSAHRAAAFEACRYVIEQVKRRVPVWKKEFYADGSVTWVDPTAVPDAPAAAALEAPR